MNRVLSVTSADRQYRQSLSFLHYTAWHTCFPFLSTKYVGTDLQPAPAALSLCLTRRMIVGSHLLAMRSF